MKTGIELITEEQERVINEEGYTPKHDDTHADEELAAAAAFFAIPEKYGDMEVFWQFDTLHKKHRHTRIEQLVIAGQFIVAEIDRLQRLSGAV